MAWKTVRADEFCSFVTDGTHDSPKPQSQGRKLITSKHLKGDYIDFDSANWISEGDYQKIIARSAVEQWDILFSMIGTIGTIYLEKNTIVEYACKNMGVFKFAGNAENACWMYYYLKSPQAKEYIQSHLRGSTQAYVPLGSLREMPVLIPDRETRNCIVSLLKPLDEKIAINRAINDDLQQQAMAIFNNAIEQSKFVTYVELGSLADIKGGKRLPKGANLMSIPNSHPYIRVRDLNDVVFASLSSNYEYVDDETQKTISRYITTADDVLISIVGTIGLTAIVDKSLNMANLTENCVKITNLHGISPEYLLLYLRSQHGSEEIKKGTVGAVQAKLPIKNIQALSVPLLPQSDLQSLNDTLKVLFNQLSINVAESKCLTDIRDSLLPKLMSGELDVSAVEL